MQLEHVLGTVSVCTMKEASNANKKQHGNDMKQMCYVGKDSRTAVCYLLCNDRPSQHSKEKARLVTQAYIRERFKRKSRTSFLKLKQMVYRHNDMTNEAYDVVCTFGFNCKCAKQQIYTT